MQNQRRIGKLIRSVNQMVLKRQFSNKVYLWAPALDARLAKISQQATKVSARGEISKGRPQRLEKFDNLDISTLRVGMRHTAAISKDGLLYMFGLGNWGVLGQGNEKNIPFDKEPALVTNFAKLGLKVVDVALGEYHTLALTDDGNVWTWGYGGKKGMFNWVYSQEVGALGHGDKEAHFVPKKVDYFEQNGIKIKSISAGMYHCNALSEDYSLYSWGRGLYGALGNASNSHSLSPQINDVVEDMKDETGELNLIEKMESCNEFTAVLMTDGSMNCWGKNDRGQLGTSPGIGMDMVESENIPTLVDFGGPAKIKNFTTGQYTMLIQDQDNNLYKTGMKMHYEPAIQNFDSLILDVNKVRSIHCGKKSYVALTEDHKMLIWGNVVRLRKDEGVPDLEDQTEGFALYNEKELFDGGTIEQLEIKHNYFGALVKE